MLALKIKINKSVSMIIAADNHFLADFTYGVLAPRPDNALIIGFDDFNNYTWYDGKPQHNDEIDIQVIDIEHTQISPPLKAKRRDMEHLKKTYECLKDELKNKGII